MSHQSYENVVWDDGQNHVSPVGGSARFGATEDASGNSAVCRKTNKTSVSAECS